MHVGLDAFAAENLATYLSEQIAATAVLPTDRRIVVERFRDEIGDWRLVVHAPVGRPRQRPVGPAGVRELTARGSASMRR